MKKQKIIYYTILGVLSGLSLALLLYFIISVLTDSFNANVGLIMCCIYTPLVVALALALMGAYHRLSQIKVIKKENFSNFHVNSSLGDRVWFLAQIRKSVRKHKGHSAVIAFQIFSDSERYQYHQLEQIKSFYGTVFSYLETLQNNKANKKKLFAGYNSHTFYMYYVYEDDEQLNKFITKLDDDLYDLYSNSEVRVNMHPTFGVYQIPKEGDVNLHECLDRAILSLRVAVSSYQVFVFYSKSIAEAAISNDSLEKDIIRGIENKEFKVYYQGKFDLQTDKFVGAEALIRWEHPQKGLFSPGAFIGECEKSGLIHVIDFYVFNQVCQDLGDWKKRGRRLIPISTNFSSYDFYRPDFLESVLKTIEQNGISPNYLEVEITESSTSSNFLYVTSVLKRLQEESIRILMDDFGTGFSSLANLRDYAIDCIKIDKSFITNLGEDVKEKEIVEAIILLARSIGLTTVAEGVQTEKQVKILKELKCNQVQGYYYCKPMPKKDFEIFLSTNEFEKKGLLL